LPNHYLRVTVPSHPVLLELKTDLATMGVIEGET
jgi:hypothetical protein